MKIIIQVAKKDAARAWGMLVRHSPGMALPDRKFIVSEEALKVLEQAGIAFKEISRSDVFSGETTGERI